MTIRTITIELDDATKMVTISGYGGTYRLTNASLAYDRPPVEVEQDSAPEDHNRPLFREFKKGNDLTLTIKGTIKNPK